MPLRPFLASAAATAAMTFASAARAQSAAPAPWMLWYDRPAGVRSGMNEALPVGNGRLGGLVYGDAAAERIVLNEDSLWSGGENPSGAYNQPGPRDRQYTGAYFGSYEKLGELLISLPGHREVTGYRRQLDLGTARAGVEAFKLLLQAVGLAAPGRGLAGFDPRGFPPLALVEPGREPANDEP